MKKLLYLFLITSVVFISCSKEEDTASIVGIWTPESFQTDATITMTIMGQSLPPMDTSFTVTSSDPDWDMGGDVEFTDDGMMIVEGDTNTYVFEGSTLTVTDSDGEEEENECTVTATTLTITWTGQDTEGDDENGTVTDYTSTITANRN